MASRRDFLQPSASALAWLPVSGRAFGEGSQPVSFYKVVYDEGIAPCRVLTDSDLEAVAAHLTRNNATPKR